MKPPISAASLDDAWYAAVRDAIRNWDGVPIRAHATRPAIEVKSINRGTWLPLELPGGSVEFTSAEERDLVMGRLNGRSEDAR